jgi:hypothetical protein
VEEKLYDDRTEDGFELVIGFESTCKVLEEGLNICGSKSVWRGHGRSEKWG